MLFFISSSKESLPTSGTLLSFNDPAPTRSLMGAVVSNAYQLTNSDHTPGIFFIFQDLSVRIEGTFCLKFMFMNLSAGYEKKSVHLKIKKTYLKKTEIR